MVTWFYVVEYVVHVIPSQEITNVLDFVYLKTFPGGPGGGGGGRDCTAHEVASQITTATSSQDAQIKKGSCMPSLCVETPTTTI